MYQSASIYHFIIPALNSDLQDSDLECSTKDNNPKSFPASFPFKCSIQGRIQDFWKEGSYGVSLVDFISFLLSHENRIFKNGCGEWC